MYININKYIYIYTCSVTGFQDGYIYIYLYIRDIGNGGFGRYDGYRYDDNDHGIITEMISHVRMYGSYHCV